MTLVFESYHCTPVPASCSCGAAIRTVSRMEAGNTARSLAGTWRSFFSWRYLSSAAVPHCDGLAVVISICANQRGRFGIGLATTTMVRTPASASRSKRADEKVSETKMPYCEIYVNRRGANEARREWSGVRWIQQAGR